MSKYQDAFPVTVLSISRDNVSYAMGYNLGDELTDEDMKVIASNLGNALKAVGIWFTLANVVESWLECGEVTND